MEPLITFIVPAYNVEKYIAECLDSLLHQTRMNHKIILVNDGSTDRTDEICRNYELACGGGVLHYVSQENQGLGAARNVGLRLVDTPYVTFLDSDDWLDITFVEKFEQLLDTTGESPEMVFTLPNIYDSATKRILPWMDRTLLEEIFSVRNGISHTITNTQKDPHLYMLEVNACRKIYRTDFLRAQNFSFPVGLKWEDVPGHFWLLHEAHTVMALPSVGFFYRINTGTNICTGEGASRLDMIPIFKELLEHQKRLDFSEVERAYVLRLIVIFTNWSIEAVNQDYIAPLLEGLHEVYRALSQTDIAYYLEHISTREQERPLIAALAGPEYASLADYRDREQILSVIDVRTGRRKNLFQRGMQCVHYHGWRYTAMRMIHRLFGR